MEINKKMKKFYLILPVLLFMISSCQKEGTDQIVSVTPAIKPPSEVITGSISGYVIDVDQLPISGAVVSHHDDYKQTDSEGRFSFSEIDLFQDGSLLEVEKEGYFSGSKKFYASDENVIAIQLSTKTFQNETTTSNGGRVDINEAFIILPTGTYSSADNKAYTGNIRVFGKWINPTDNQDSYEMPGDLTGYDADRNLRALICFSMLKIGLEDDSDEIIELSEGQTVVINFPIPEELQKYAPEEIPLWYYNEPNGSWIQDGIATLKQDSYEGEVTHISVWACSVSHPAVEISGTCHSNGSVLGSKRIKMIDNQTGYISYSTTNENGHFITKIPARSIIDLEVESECSNSTLEWSSDPFLSDTPIGIIDIPSDGMGIVNIKGHLSDCDGGDLSNTYLKINIGGNKSLIKADLSNEMFSKNVSTNCGDSEISIIAINLDTKNASGELSEAIKDEINFSDVEICDSVQSGYTIDYESMNWHQALANEVRHSWSKRTILSSNKKTIINPSIVDTDNNQLVYLSGGFVILEESDGMITVNYSLRFESQDFSISGTCDVTIEDHGTFNSYRFHNNNSANQEITDADISDIGIVEFDLVYYD